MNTHIKKLLPGLVILLASAFSYPVLADDDDDGYVYAPPYPPAFPAPIVPSYYLQAPYYGASPPRWTRNRHHHHDRSHQEWGYDYPPHHHRKHHDDRYWR